MKSYKVSSIIVAILILFTALPQAASAQLIIDRITVKEKAAEVNTFGGMQVSFYTSLPATSRIDYGTTTNYDFFNGSSQLATYHEILLVGLKKNTTYHYRITVRTSDGEEATTVDYTFNSGNIAGVTTNDLALTDVRVTAVGGTYFIVTWLANESLTGEVHYNTVESFVTPAKVRAAKYGNRFEAVAANLKLNTKYYWRAYVYDKDGNNGSSSVQTLTTSAVDGAKEQLIVSEVSPASQADLRLTDTTAVIKWHTNLPAKADVNLRSSVRGAGGGSVRATVYATDHEAVFTNLKPNTPYTFTISAQDVHGKRVTTGNFGFTTKPAPISGRVAGATACPRGAAAWAYGQCRNLTAERAKAIELKEHLRVVYHNRVPVTALNNWYLLVNAYTYGGYTKEAIVAAVKHGGKTVHPTISFSAWQNSRDYKDYINR
jgi:hypothetical protein